MEGQVYKIMRVVNRGNEYDPDNNRNYRDFNPMRHMLISKNIYDFYVQFPGKCETCPLDYHKKYLGLNIEPPKCIKQCRFKVHRCGGNKKDSWKNNAKPVVETLTRIPGIKGRADEVIFLSRSMLLWLYHYNIPMIFRPGKMNGYIIHHKNRNPFDDRPENIVIILKQEHTNLHGHLRRIDNTIVHLEDEMRLNPKAQNLLKLLDQQARLRNSMLMKVNNDPAVFKLIQETVDAIQNISLLAV